MQYVAARKAHTSKPRGGGCRAQARSLRLSDDVPLRACFPEVTGEPLLQLAVEGPPLLGNRDGVPDGKHEVERLTPHHAGCVQRESTGRDQRRHDCSQRAAVKERTAKQRVGAGQLSGSSQRTLPLVLDVDRCLERLEVAIPESTARTLAEYTGWVTECRHMTAEEATTTTID